MKYPIPYKGAVGFPRLIDENIIAMLNNEESFFSDDEPKPELNLPVLNDTNKLVMREAKTRDDEDDMKQQEMDDREYYKTQELQSRVCDECNTVEDSEHDSSFKTCVQNGCCHCCILCVRE